MKRILPFRDYDARLRTEASRKKNHNKKRKNSRSFLDNLGQKSAVLLEEYSYILVREGDSRGREGEVFSRKEEKKGQYFGEDSSSLLHLNLAW